MQTIYFQNIDRVYKKNRINKHKFIDAISTVSEYCIR